MPWLSWNNKTLRLMVGWLWIATITLVVYSDTFTAPFIFDDFGAAYSNKNILQLWPIWKTMTTASPTSISGRPMVGVSLAINYAISGEKVWSFHVFNAATHLACSLLLLLLLIRVFASEAAPARIRPYAQPLALAVVLVWSIHPLLTESVIYIVQRTELMVTFFYLFTIYCTAHAFETPAENPGVRRCWLTLGVIACAMGMGTKEVMISAPLAVLVYDRLFLHRSWGKALREWRVYYICLASTALILIALAATSPRGNSVGFHIGIHWLDYLYTQAWVIALYLKLCFLPTNLCILYDIALTRHLVDAAIPGIVILFFIALTVRGLISGRAGAMAGAVFFMVLAPSSSFIPIVTEIVAERRMYLPLAMVLAVVAGCAANAFAWACEKWPKLGSPTPAIAAAALTIAAFFSYESIERGKDYRTPEGVWRDVTAKWPGHPSAWNNLATVIASLNRNPEAAGCFLKASQLRSNIPEMYDQYLAPKAYYALLLGMMGDLEGSRKTAEEVLALQPTQYRARNALALYHMTKGDLQHAIWQADIAVQANDSNNNAWAIRSRILTRLGRYLEAAASLDRAVAIDAQTQINIVAADELSTAGPEASKVSLPALRHLASAAPQKAAPKIALARALGDVGRLDECVEQFRAALAIDPENVTTWQNYSSALARLGRYPEVVQALEHVVSLAPNEASAHSRLGLALAHVGRMQDAVKEWKRAIGIDPDDADARANLARFEGAPKP